MLPGIDERECRTEAVVADAAMAIVGRPARERTGRLLLDEDVLREEGVTDFARYAVEPGYPLRTDLFVER
jgi:citronellol/citronellal dehydrogenase